MAAARERVGRPTQFHGVPLEERAFDSQGNRLPWALEWADDHPNARHQKRQPEEKGPFGKSTRRKGSSRTTRTQTPARKENPTLDGFEAALKHDAQRVTDLPQPSNSSKGQSGVLGPVDSNLGIHHTPSISKDPTQVILYGYSPETQWAAVSFYETVSGGMICEDYERQPPLERRKYQTSLGYNGYNQPRTLTKAERALSCQYEGGACWIKVTFESAEAAERAIYNSPHLIQGHWVYAQLFHGQGPEVDEPILVRDEERGQGLLDARRQSQTLGVSFSMSALNRNTASRATATLPRSFTTRASLPTGGQQTAEVVSLTSSTISSATARAPEYPDLRRRISNQASEVASPESDGRLQKRPTTFTHFPNTPRTVLHPASEAFLPQPSWTDSLLRRLTRSGWIPGDVIGNVVPRLDNGDFDWKTASFYWKLCYWLDTYLGTDLCGMKES